MSPTRAVAVVVVALAVAFATAACPPQNTPQPMPPGPGPGDGYQPPPPLDGGAPTTDPPLGTVGDACDRAADCESGLCEGAGCGAGQGTCVPADRVCTADVQPFCGCDGATFTGSSGCPGQRYDHKGACGPRPDGEACLSGGDCTSGTCEGQGCGADQPGVCAPAQRSCTKDLRAYCGCDGTTFRGSGSCPGQRYASKGACP